jgi:hypothetical protein
MDAVMNSHSKPLRLACAAMSLLLVFAGCGMIDRQVDAESKFAIDLAFWMKVNDAVSSDTPVTNLAQIFPVIPHGYSYYHHHEFARFGKHAGFTNSLAEKYVFFWPRFTNRFVEGNVICMSAQPFPKGQDGPHRIYITRRGSNYIYRLMDEAHVQAVFKEAKPAIVPFGKIKPPPEPPPEVAEQLRTSPNEHFDKFTRDLANALGQDSASGIRMVLKIGMGAAAVLTVIFLFIWNSRRGRP